MKPRARDPFLYWLLPGAPAAVLARYERLAATTAVALLAATVEPLPDPVRRRLLRGAGRLDRDPREETL